MCNRTTTDHSEKRIQAFTMMELTMVVAILILLMAILIPSFSGAKKYARSVASQAWINDLANGVRQYALDNNNFFPGQRNLADLDPNNISFRTGTQALAGAMFFAGTDYNPNDPSLDPNNPSDPNHPDMWKPRGIFATPAEGDLRTFKIDPGNVNTWYENTIYDRYGDQAMPILYYPANVTVSGLNQYQMIQNSVYTGANRIWVDWRKTLTDPNDPNNVGQLGFENFIRDTRFKGPDSNEPYNPGEFLIIGAGIDRIYGTTDDLKNW